MPSRQQPEVVERPRPRPAAGRATEIRDITVIGAGPVGLVAVSWAGMLGASVRVVDSLPDVGGRLTQYPDRWICDVPGHERVLAKDLLEQLCRQSLDRYDVPVYLNTTAEAVEYDNDPDHAARRMIRLTTTGGELLTRTIVIAGATGGAFHDWPLEVDGGSIFVDSLMRTSMYGVWAAGDVAAFDGKLKVLATGFAEAAIAVAQAVQHIRPGMPIQPDYSSGSAPEVTLNLPA